MSDGAAIFNAEQQILARKMNVVYNIRQQQNGNSAVPYKFWEGMQ